MVSGKQAGKQSDFQSTPFNVPVHVALPVAADTRDKVSERNEQDDSSI